MDGYAEFCAAEIAWLARFATALTGERQSANDLLADSLVQAQVHWDRVADAKSPLAYVRRIIANNYLSQRRSWASRHISLTRTGELPQVATNSSVAVVDDRAELESLLRDLPKQQRAAVVLRYYLDLPDDSIAAILHCSPATVRSHLSHAPATLRIVASSTASLEE